MQSMRLFSSGFLMMLLMMLLISVLMPAVLLNPGLRISLSDHSGFFPAGKTMLAGNLPFCDKSMFGGAFGFWWLGKSMFGEVFGSCLPDILCRGLCCVAGLCSTNPCLAHALSPV